MELDASIEYQFYENSPEPPDEIPEEVFQTLRRSASTEDFSKILRFEILKSVGRLCQDLEGCPQKDQAFANADLSYDNLPFWYHTKLDQSLCRRTTINNIGAPWTFVPDICFLNGKSLKMARKIYEKISSTQYEEGSVLTRSGNRIPEDLTPTLCELKINFCNWSFLQKNNNLRESEKGREQAKDIIIAVLNRIMKTGQQYGIRFVFSVIDLSHTVASMRALFQGEDGRGLPIHREQEVEYLDLSYSSTSPRSLRNFCKAVNLKVLWIDHCSQLIRNKQSKTSNVFSLLVQHNIPSLEVLSVVGTSELLSSEWIKQVEKGCPKLHTLYFTRKQGEKAIGWDDIILMQSMRAPALLPCGHIADFEALKEMRNHLCSLDRHPFNMSSIVLLSPHITKLKRSDDKKSWSAEIVDHNREPLTEKVLYHVECGEFYNPSTIQNKYSLTLEKVEELQEKLMNQICYSCFKKFLPDKLRICFPQSAKLHPDEKKEFSGLNEIGNYTLDM